MKSPSACVGASERYVNTIFAIHLSDAVLRAQRESSYAAIVVRFAPEDCLKRHRNFYERDTTSETRQLHISAQRDEELSAFWGKDCGR